MEVLEDEAGNICQKKKKRIKRQIHGKQKR